MQVHLDATTFATDTRPLVIAVLSLGPEISSHAVLLAVKEAVTLGADLVEFGQPVPAAATSVNEAPWVAAAASLAEMRQALDKGASVVHWLGSPDAIGTVFATAQDIPVITETKVTPRPHDWPCVAVADLITQNNPVESTRCLIADLADETSPARLAAHVTVALELGAQGFRTVAPRAVRRAAHVIRMIEATQ